MRTTLKRTTRHAHLTQSDGLQIDRTIYTDGENEYIKINGFVFDLWNEIANFNTWTINYVY